MFRIEQVKYRNNSRKTAKELTNQLVGVVGDSITAEIVANWTSIYNDDFDIQFTPAALDIGLPPATSTIGYVFSPDNIFTDDIFKVGDKIGVQKVSETLAYFEILEVISPQILRFDIAGSTIFATTWNVNSNATQYIGCAPDVNNLILDYSINNNFNGFDLEVNGNGQWTVFEPIATFLNYTQGSKGVNRQGSFTVGQVINSNNLSFQITIFHSFILYPFYLEGETQPEIPSRFLGSQNCLNYFFQLSLKKHDKSNTRVVQLLDKNGNTGGIGQTINTGVDLINFSDLVILDADSNPIGAILTPQEYTATLQLNYTSPAVASAADTCKAWGYIEQETITPNTDFRPYFVFDSATRKNVDFLAAAASVNDFTDYILIDTVKAETISSETVVTIVFKVTDAMPKGNLVLCLNIEPDTVDNTRRCLFVGSFPISKTPPDLKITFDETTFEKHLTVEDKISPNQEVLCVNRFFVELPNTVKLNNIKTRFVAQTTAGGQINTLEQNNIITASFPVLDGQFQNLVATVPKVYPRAENDKFKNIIIRRNESHDTSTLRCFEVLTPYIFRYEFWRRLFALNGETLTANAFDSLQPFNGFNQFWARYGNRFNNVIDLTCIIEGQEFTISSGLQNDVYVEFEDYTTGSIIVENTVVNGTVIAFGENQVIASKQDATFEDFSLADARAILWANLKDQNGIETNARISYLLQPDPLRLWKSANVTISKSSADTFDITATLDGKKLTQGNELTIWADLMLIDPPLGDFVFKVKTDNAGVSPSDSFRLPLISTGSYNFVVDWGDSSTDTITTWNQTEATHKYASAGTYTVTILGLCKGWQFNNARDRLKFIEIARWGCFDSGNTIGTFRGCANLILNSVEDVPYLADTSTFEFFFANCTSIATINKVGDWDVSTITNMKGMFFNATSFNQSLNTWNVSNVVNFQSMFDFASVFNGSIIAWNTANATNMSFMFFSALAFNQNISSWSVVNVTNFDSMFTFNTVFNQNIGSWNMTKAQNINSMFENATAFNQNISTWNVINITSAANFMNGKLTANFSHIDAVYTAWGALTVKSGVTISFGGIEYTSAGAAGRASLVLKGWTITDGGII